MAGRRDPRPQLSLRTAALDDAVLGVPGHEQRPERRLVYDDDEQPLEKMIQAVREDVVRDGRAAEAAGSILAAMP